LSHGRFLHQVDSHQQGGLRGRHIAKESIHRRGHPVAGAVEVRVGILRTPNYVAFAAASYQMVGMWQGIFPGPGMAHGVSYGWQGRIV